jgi:predicted Zn-dependent protease
LAIRYDDSLGAAKNNLAFLIADRGGDLDRALILAQEAKAGMPGDAATADTLGWVLLKRGVASAAIGYLKEAIAGTEPGQPARSQIRNHLAMAYESAGELDNAVTATREALVELAESQQIARDQGADVVDPPWVAQARVRLERLEGQG